MTPMAREDYRVGVPRKKQYKLILNSHDEKFGGNDIVENRETVYKSAKGECDKQPYSFSYPLPAYGVAVFEF
jgi:1,4-alpha-glucan branching enzyme